MEDWQDSLPAACNIVLQGNWYVVQYTNEYGVKVSYWLMKAEE